MNKLCRHFHDSRENANGALKLDRVRFELIFLKYPFAAPMVAMADKQHPGQKNKINLNRWLLIFRSLLA
jgi:hypothetical protein